MNYFKFFAKLLASIITLSTFQTHAQENITVSDNGSILIQWVESLPGDFSFSKKWEYPEGVFKNKFGQLSCDGLCPPETKSMMDSKGKIYKDSLASFYKLVDTTHQFYTLQSSSNMSEFAEANFMDVTRINKDLVICASQTNVATHCSLILTLSQDNCIPLVELNSIASNRSIEVFKCNGGFIQIDKKLWSKGILKANFDLSFDGKNASKEPIKWKGKIYSKFKTQ